MNFSRRSRPIFHREIEDSLIISDSDEEVDSSFRRNITTARDPKVIGDSDSESENSHNVESHAESHENSNSTESVASEDEDLQFMNVSHKVSIIESSDLESDESDHGKTFKLNKLKRRSIYENPVNSPKSKSTPVNAHKRYKRVIIDSDDTDSDSTPANNQNSLLEKVNKSLTCSNKIYNKNNVRERSIVEIGHLSLNDSDTNKQISVNVNSEIEQNEMEVSVSSLNNKDDSESNNYSSEKENASDLSKSPYSSDFAKPMHRNITKNRFTAEKISENETIIDLTMNNSQENSPIKNQHESSKKKNKIRSPTDRLNNNSFKNNIDKKHIDDGKVDNSEIIINSSTNSSDNEVDPEAAVLAKKEIGVGNIDPIEAQKREHLEINIKHIKGQLDKLYKFSTSVDVKKLPDQGAKVHQTIKEHEDKIKALELKLYKLTRKTKSNISQIIKTPTMKVESRRNVDLNDSFDNNVMKIPTSNIKKEHKKYNSSDDSLEMSPKKNQLTNKDKNTRNNNVKRETNNRFEDFDIHNIPNVPQESFDTADLGKKALETLHKQQMLTHQRIDQLHGSLTSRPTEDIREKDPYGLNISLMPHQQHALAWMKWREKQKPKGGVLADDMGLGKTLTMISLVLANINERDSDDSDTDDDDDQWYSKSKRKRYYGGTLVVCPASLLRQWEAEVKNRVKRSLLSVLVYHGNNRNVEERKLSKYNIVVTTYQILVREAAAETGLYKMKWNRIILDEAHYIRNHKSKACLAVTELNAKNRWALTGTPIQNKEADLYAILKFLKCSPFDNFQVWKRWVENKSDAGRQRLVTIMKTIMLRRTKQELQSKGTLESLPEKFSEIVEIDMDKEETLVYQKILLFSQNLFAQFLTQRAEKHHFRELHGGKFDKPSFLSFGPKTHFTKAQQVLLNHHKEIESHEILVLLLRLRQMCCHPALIHAMLDQNDAEISGLFEDEDVNTDLLSKLKNMSMNDEEDIEEHIKNYEIDDKITSNLLTTKNPVFDRDRRGSKVRAVIKTIKKIINKGEKLIVVSQWSSFLKVIAKNLEDIEDAKYDMFTGDVAVKNRQAIIDKFNNPGEDTNVLLLSLTAGGVGLNLVGANHLLLIDIHWNPQLESQAQDRIYRFGQKKNVYIYKYICKDTIEERVKQLQENKLKIANHVLTGTKSMSSKLTIEDLRLLFS